MSTYLLREYFELCPGDTCQDLLTEEDKRRMREGITILTGMVQHAGKLNGNGRIYPRPVLEREVKRYQSMVEDRRALGELDHPEDSIINLKNASHLITEVWWDGDQVMAKLEVLNTPSGKILKELISGGVKLGISSRGLGSVRNEAQGTIVEDDFQLICFDMVSEPSTPNAFMLREHKERKSPTKQEKINQLLDDIIEK
jgi:hypothetical protein|tara:strand:+ start:707 stop:1303 length:597 start_codon:yes stop_codon:yes gene_type:complete